MTKEEKIKEAWGEYYEINKELIDCNGWLRCCSKTDINTLNFIEENKDKFDDLVCNTPDAFLVFHRPISLKGIETNNGWIKIKSEEDLPNDDAFYYKICINNKPRNDYSLSVIEIRRYYYNLNNVTHFQKIITNEPIY